jgi:hypothetical protein
MNTNNNEQIIAQKTKDWATWTTQKTEWWANVFRKVKDNLVLLFSFISYNWDLTRVTWRVLLVQQKTLTLRNTLAHHSVFCVVHVAQSLVFCAIICSLLFVFMCFSRYTVGPSSTCLLITTLESSKHGHKPMVHYCVKEARTH